MKNESFETGSLVWVKQSETLGWQVRYYSHEGNGDHFCFNNQKESGPSAPWPIVQAFENSPFATSQQRR